MSQFQNTIEEAWEDRALLEDKSVQEVIRSVIDQLDKGDLRVAEPTANGWQVNEWVKKAVVLYFPIQGMETLQAGPLEFHDKIPLKTGYKYFAATSTGLYSTDQLDGTSTVWVQEGPSTIGNVVVDMIDGRPADGHVAIATHGNGMYSANFGGDVLSVDDSDLPTSFELAENYPNPFNPSTQIPFTLNKGGIVTLKVFDIAGREVATLFHGEKSAGAHHVTWNGKDGFGNQMPTGMYIYRIESNGLVQSKKMQLLK